MSLLRLVLPFATLSLLAACDGSAPSAPGASAPAPGAAPAVESADDVLTRRQLSEQRMELIVDIARELRDTRGGMAPEWSTLESEVRARQPADVLRDGWGRTFEYEARQESGAGELRNGFTIWSRGPDGEFQRGGGDDLERAVLVTASTTDG